MSVLTHGPWSSRDPRPLGTVSNENLRRNWVRRAIERCARSCELGMEREENAVWALDAHEDSEPVAEWKIARDEAERSTGFCEDMPTRCFSSPADKQWNEVTRIVDLTKVSELVHRSPNAVPSPRSRA